MDSRVGSSILNEMHTVGLTEKVIFGQRQEASGREPSGQVWRKKEELEMRVYMRWWKKSKEASVTRRGGTEKNTTRIQRGKDGCVGEGPAGVEWSPTVDGTGDGRDICRTLWAITCYGL